MKLLLVEDNTAMQTTLVRSFERRGVQVVVCGDGARALDRWRAAVPDVVLLDLTLPGLDGLQVLAAARAEGLDTPVLIVTARGTVGDRVLGLNTGADDYLAKPFELPELLARVRSILRRRHWDRREEKHGGPRAVVTIGEVRVDFESHEVSVRGEPVKLTRLELDLLRYFVEHPGKVVSRQQLLEEVWKLHNYSTARTVDNFVSRLRRHLEPDPQNPTHIVSVRGAGYKFVP